MSSFILYALAALGALTLAATAALLLLVVLDNGGRHSGTHVQGHPLDSPAVTVPVEPMTNAVG